MVDIVGIVDAVVDGLSRAAKAAGKATGLLSPAAAPQDPRFFNRDAASIAAMARKSVLLFPVVTSESVSPEAAANVAKALNVRYAEYVRVAVANMGAVAAEPGREKDHVFSQVRGASLGAPIFEQTPEAADVVRRRCAELCEELMAPPGPRIRGPLEALREAEGDPEDPRRFMWAGPDADGEVPPPGASGGGQEAPRGGWGAQGPRPDRGDADAMGERDRQRQGQAQDRGPRPDAAGKPPKAYTGPEVGWDAKDVSKVNAFVPIVMTLKFEYVVLGPDGSPVPGVPARDAELVFGVKAVVHPVPGTDLVQGIGTSLHRDSMFLQFLRLTSGEISLVHDFILRVDVARDRAAPGTGAGKRALETLRRQAEWNAARKRWIATQLPKRGYVPPTATLVISASEAQQIKSRYRTDVMSAGAIRQVLRAHNLMGIAVVDESVGSVSFFEDGSDAYERIPLEEAARRGKDGESGVRDIIRILSRSN